MPKVSVIIPTYNCVKYLPEAIESVLNQTYRDFEIIVIDDGSTDETKEILSRYSENPNVIVCHQENQGVAGARNKGIDLSRGDYICFLDNDDILGPVSLEKRAVFLDRHPEVCIVFSDHDIEDRFQFRQTRLKEARFLQNFQSFVYWSKKHDIIFNEGFYTHFFDFLPYPIWTGTVMIRKEKVKEIGYFRNNLPGSTDDTDYWIRTITNERVGYIDESTAKYNYCRSNLSKVTTENNCLKKIENCMLLLRQGAAERSNLKDEISRAYYSLGSFYLHEGFFLKSLGAGLKSLEYNYRNSRSYKIVFFSLPLNFLSEKSQIFRVFREKMRKVLQCRGGR